jgi:hypothetical protein
VADDVTLEQVVDLPVHASDPRNPLKLRNRSLALPLPSTVLAYGSLWFLWCDRVEMKLKPDQPNQPFKVGDRVRLSPFSRATRRRKTCSPGTVIGYSEHAIVVRVLFDGRKTPCPIHATLLEPEFDSSRLDLIARDPVPA